MIDNGTRTRLCLKRYSDVLYDGPPRPSSLKQPAFSTASEGHRTSFQTEPRSSARVCSASRRRGMVLVLVLVVIALLALACFTFAELMLTERKAARLAARRAQARAAADSGVEMARLFLAQDEELQLEAGSWYDNEMQFRGIVVSSDEQDSDIGRFTIIAPRMESGFVDGLRYGLESESARLNLNALVTLEGLGASGARDILMGLPGMTEDIADAILDWIDEDDEPREYGAEFDYYASLDSPYAPKNGPLETVEELLLVRDVTPQLLLGCDANRNALADPYESAGAALVGTDSVAVDSVDGSMDRGWSAYLTLYSVETNLQPDGERKIDLNQDDMEQLYDQLEEALENSQWATYIVALRQYGPYGSDASTPGYTDPYSTNPYASGQGNSQGGDGKDVQEQPLNLESLNIDPSTIDPTTMSEEELQELIDQVSALGQQVTGSLTNSTAGGGGSSPPGNETGYYSFESTEEPAEPFSEDFEPDLSKQGKYALSTVLDLIGKKVKVELPPDDDGEKKEVVYQSPFSELPSEMSNYLPILMDYVAVNTSEKIPGRIDINRASQVVLQGIPGMTPEIVDEILAERQPDPVEADVTRRHETWILSEGIVSLSQMKQLIPFVTAGGSAYRAQVVGYFDRGGPAVRVETVLDATTSPARLRLFRDLSHLGRGYAMETLGIEDPGLQP